jgi:hypothetical protein
MPGRAELMANQKSSYTATQQRLHSEAIEYLNKEGVRNKNQDEVNDLIHHILNKYKTKCMFLVMGFDATGLLPA